MAHAKVLVVDDDRKVVDLIRLYLEKDGYQVLSAYDGQQALAAVRQRQPDLVVLDVMLPQMDGLDVCRVLRSEGVKTPVIMLTAKTLDTDKILGLDLGADDYVTKPFSPRELMARVRAVLRRLGNEQMETPERMIFGEVTVDLTRYDVQRSGEQVQLTPTEFKLLVTLAKEPGRAFSRLTLLDRVFGVDYEGLERTVDVHVMNLRRKIEDDPGQPRLIVTVPGVGYRFEGHNAA